MIQLCYNYRSRYFNLIRSLLTTIDIYGHNALDIGKQETFLFLIYTVPV